ncbi:Mobile element protein [Methanosarcina mazei S-6]|uniref:Mobile element protein n=1 Tax=Methanosarcina mazei S-6 TaxID=213585 RepID=A0A0E3RMX6_METMZ|nr:Mobile element protein [Methanosarcina mazei S-6]
MELGNPICSFFSKKRSIKEAGKWLNQKEILDILNLEKFHEEFFIELLNS